MVLRDFCQKNKISRCRWSRYCGIAQKENMILNGVDKWSRFFILVDILKGFPEVVRMLDEEGLVVLLVSLG